MFACPANYVQLAQLRESFCSPASYPSAGCQWSVRRYYCNLMMIPSPAMCRALACDSLYKTIS